MVREAARELGKSVRFEQSAGTIKIDKGMADNRAEKKWQFDTTGAIRSGLVVSEGMVYVGKEVTAIYSGLKKATYALVVLAFIALLIATAVGQGLYGQYLAAAQEEFGTTVNQSLLNAAIGAGNASN